MKEKNVINNTRPFPHLAMFRHGQAPSLRRCAISTKTARWEIIRLNFKADSRESALKTSSI